MSITNLAVVKDADDEGSAKKTNLSVASTMNHVKAKIPLKELVTMENILPKLTKEQQDEIGRCAVTGYQADLQSRIEWTQRNADAIKLALQVVEAKSFPWENCANVKFPLVTVAALQFLSRVSILTNGQYPVRVSVIGADPKGEAEKCARRVSTHMSWQITEEDPNWLDDDEKTKFCAALMGCAFKKTYFDPVSSKNVSEFVPAQNFVVDYNTKSLDRCNRATHLIPWTLNDIKERENAGLFLEMTDQTPSPQAPSDELQVAADEAAGTRENETEAEDIYQFLEQHLWLDLDGDGYAEPYVAYVRLDSQQCLRLVARFFDEGDVIRKNDRMVRLLNAKIKVAESIAEKKKLEVEVAKLIQAPDNKVIRITPPEYFTKYTFIPSPDGGFYDLGFGSLLGPLNETVNTLVNQMLDSGTMNTTAGGFLGRGVKLKGGQSSFDPFEWKPVDSTGDDLRKNIFPLPVREPSPTLFQLLSLLITYGEKISGATDIMTGVSPGQNTPAETSRNTIEQGMKIFSGIFRRMHRGFTSELKKMYMLNRMYLKSTPQWDQLTDGPMALIAPTDYDPDNYRIAPSVMPTMVSEAQRQTNATMVYQLSQSTGGFNNYLVVKEVLEAYQTPNIELMYPDPAGPNAIPPGVDPKMEIEKQKLQIKNNEIMLGHQAAMAELQQQALLNGAQITQLQAQATKLLADAEGIDVGHQIALLNAQIGAARSHEDTLFKALGHMQKAIDQRQAAAKEGIPDGGAKQAGSAAAGVARVAAAPSNPEASDALAAGPV